jgi:hypothetical protein
MDGAVLDRPRQARPCLCRSPGSTGVVSHGDGDGDASMRTKILIILGVAVVEDAACGHAREARSRIVCLHRQRGAANRR